MKLATRNTTESKQPTLTQIAVSCDFDAACMDAFLSNEENYAVTKIKVKGQEQERRYKRPTPITVPTPIELFVAVAKVAAENGGVANGDIVTGRLAIAARKPLLATYLGYDDAQIAEYERQREEAISSARAERMRDVANRLGMDIEAAKQTLSVVEKMRGNSKLQALLAKDPEFAEFAALLADMDTES